ncbi:hypothetical protein CBR_g48367 [Chara braunii]|uniref:GT23 domain-containing protein n=1 Tax=Chara braunii TaxID=69332 RepID=A0A388K4C6_CHABU|nr:hypothetical protein CBR_g48367 [Chara braunii]|eukprot:GBG64901.1 hypothetical protein CBR_g48367 [Chara braunii]
MGKLLGSVGCRVHPMAFIIIASLLFSLLLLSPSVQWIPLTDFRILAQTSNCSFLDSMDSHAVSLGEDATDLSVKSMTHALNRLAERMHLLQVMLERDRISLKRILEGSKALRRVKNVQKDEALLMERTSLKASIENLRQAVISSGVEFAIIGKVSEQIINVLEPNHGVQDMAAGSIKTDGKHDIPRPATNSGEVGNDTGGHVSMTPESRDDDRQSQGGVSSALVSTSSGSDDGDGRVPGVTVSHIVPVTSVTNGSGCNLVCNCSAVQPAGNVDCSRDGDSRDGNSSHYSALARRVVRKWGSLFTSRGNSNAFEEGSDEGHSVKEGAQLTRDAHEEEKEVEELLLQFKPPPHLQDCGRATKLFSEADRRNPDGSLPNWALDEPPKSFLEELGGILVDSSGSASDSIHGPFPPWIHGGDGDNLPLTRIVQRDLWTLQHPGNCSAPDVRFAVAEWWPMSYHGIGSQLHGMTALLGAAIETGRVLVPVNNYQRADQDNCKGDLRKRLDCYFFPPTSPECYRRAMELLEQAERQEKKAKEENRTMPYRAKDEGVWQLMDDKNLPLVYLEHGNAFSAPGRIPQRWGSPWKKTVLSVIMDGKVFGQLQGDGSRTQWWRAQALRYLLRQPTEYLCQVVNHVRNRAFGMLVAEGIIASSRRLRNESLYFVDVKDNLNDWHRVNITEDDEMNARRDGSLVATGQGLYVPRPLVSIIVRSGAFKAGEMKLYSLPSFMRIAERIRQYDPDLKHVWLTADVQDSMNQSSRYDAWKFFYSHQHRLTRDEEDWKLEMEGGQNWDSETAHADFEVVETSFANLLISSEADYFIGVLGSNWARMVNEMRMTNGRLSRKYITVNYGEWRR